MKNKRVLTAIIILALLALISGICLILSLGKKEKIKVLILPKFEVGEMEGDFPGEAQYYYEAYAKGGKTYRIIGGFEDEEFYVKDGVGLYITGMGKVNSALSLGALLGDKRFDFSDAYIISTGCAGGAVGYSVIGDVYVISSVVDFDLGHTADPRDQTEDSVTTWYHADDYDSAAYKLLNAKLTDKVYELVKDVPLETTERSRRYMSDSFDGEAWSLREPAVLRGTGVSGDNYWKGYYDHENAILMTETYGCPDPFAVTEMEDVALAVLLDRLGMLDRYIILRDVVDMDVFTGSMTPESLWGTKSDDELASEDSEESADIFPVAQENNFKVGKVLIDAILDGKL